MKPFFAPSFGLRKSCLYSDRKYQLDFRLKKGKLEPANHGRCRAGVDLLPAAPDSVPVVFRPHILVVVLVVKPPALDVRHSAGTFLATMLTVQQSHPSLGSFANSAMPTTTATASVGAPSPIATMRAITNSYTMLAPQGAGVSADQSGLNGKSVADFSDSQKVVSAKDRALASQVCLDYSTSRML